MDIKKEELLPYTMQMASKMLGLPQEKKCECGKWHDGEGYCAECREEMDRRYDEQVRYSSQGQARESFENHRTSGKY